MSLPQRIAITGASGLIGTALVGHLKSEGHTVQKLVRRKALSPPTKFFGILEVVILI